MTLLDPRLWLAIAVALGIAYGSGRYHQWRSDEKEHVTELLKATEKAREREHQWQIDAQAAEEVQNEELRRVRAGYDRTIAGLRNRPERMPEAAASAVSGATGAQLSRPDAEFLAREAARANELRASVARCQAWIESVTK